MAGPERAHLGTGEKRATNGAALPVEPDAQQPSPSDADQDAAARIRRLREQLAEAESAIAVRNLAIGDAARLRDQLQRSNAELSSKIETLIAEMGVVTALAERARMDAGKEAAKLRQAIKQKDEKLKALSENNTKFRAVIQNTRDQAEAQSQTAARELQAAAAKFDKLAKSYGLTKAAKKAAEKALAETTAELEKIKNSTSWKITSPLRKFTRSET